MNILIAFYSRTGVTRKAAEAIGERLKAFADVTIEEIVDKKERGGVWGWLVAGKDATRKLETEIEPLKSDVPTFDAVVIGSPVWAWTIVPAVRTFCKAQGKDAKKVAFFCTMGGSGDKGAFKAMQALCGKEPAATAAFLERQVKGESEEFRAGIEALAAGIQK